MRMKDAVMTKLEQLVYGETRCQLVALKRTRMPEGVLSNGRTLTMSIVFCISKKVGKAGNLSHRKAHPIANTAHDATYAVHT